MSRDQAHHHPTLARLARGKSALFGPISLLLIVSLPIIFFVPLLTTNFWFFMQTDITLAHAISELFQIDKFLFAVVVLFGVVFPFLKASMSVVCWYHFEIYTAGRCLEALSYVAKLSMLDIMMLAFFVVAFEGVGIGTVHVRYGLYVYASLVMASLVLNLAMTPVAKRIQLQQKQQET